MQTAVYAVITGRAHFDLELQIIQANHRDAMAEVRDLKKNYGCDDARCKHFQNESDAYDWIEKNS